MTEKVDLDGVIHPDGLGVYPKLAVETSSSNIDKEESGDSKLMGRPKKPKYGYECVICGEKYTEYSHPHSMKWSSTKFKRLYGAERKKGRT